MARFPFTPAIVQSDRIRSYTEGAAQTFKLGAAVVITAGLVVECGADPALILGFACHDATKNLPATDDLVAIAEEGKKFWCSYVGGTPVLLTDYGLTKQADGIWALDVAKTGASARLEVHKVDTERSLALVSVLAANRQLAP